ncbi:5-methylcytosine-specific restriction enzyme subunit McrC [Litorimonas taeanensis]|uniref:5-methylcytosine-specific restriction enzyme subunit McrC n=1 Tax=Litorimonas taeanensis TaxID=568099 RepID=A0A420WFG9_9PROT|nr:5-methylcytosine-specific restriction enzyme subunit McrC [Litorimonas taeanensis]
MRTLTIFEHAYVSISDKPAEGRLMQADVEALDLAQKSMGANAFAWDGRNRIKASQFVGIIAAPGIRLEILPKIDKSENIETRGTLIKMIAAALSIPIYDGDITPLNSQDQDFLEILVLVFARRLASEVRKGLTRNYKRQTDDLARLRGKLDVTRQFTKFAATPQILACEFDEFSADNALNRLLACATSLLMRKTNVATTQRLLAEIDAHFAEVSPVTVQQALQEPIILDRKNQRWSVCEKLARLLLQSLYQTVHGGKREGVALLFDMNKLFEAYVTRLAQKTLRPMGYTVWTQKPQKALVHDKEGRRAFITKPDIYVKGHGEVIIIDTKWKTLDFSKGNFGISQADAYQMHGYARVYDATKTILLYPQMHDKSGAFASWTFENSDTQLQVATIDILDETKMAESLLSIVQLQGNSLSGTEISQRYDHASLAAQV